MSHVPMILIKLSENEKRILIALCLLVLLVIVLFGYLYILVHKIMERQGKQVDKMMYDIMKARVITDAKTFRKVALYKSHLYFVKKAWIPFLIMVIAVLGLLIYGWSTNDPGLAYFGKAWQDLSIRLSWPMGDFFGLHVPVDWPTIAKAPDFTFSFEKYFSVFCTLVGAYGFLAFLIRVQALIARFLRIRKLRKTYFSKDLNKLSEQQM